MRIFKRLLGGNILFYPGCMFKFVLKDLEKKYEKILKKCGIDFIKLKELEVCCGSPVLNAGYQENFRLLAKRNLRIFEEHGVKKIITPCPACFKTFKMEYPKLIGAKFEVEHITQTIWKAIESKRLRMNKVGRRTRVTFHDPCYLGRYCEVYEEPRKILESLGYEVVEMEFSQENSWCCGGGGGVQSNYPELTEEISKERIAQALATHTKLLVTACPMCYVCLQKAAGKKIKVVEFSSLF